MSEEAYEGKKILVLLILLAIIALLIGISAAIYFKNKSISSPSIMGKCEMEDREFDAFISYSYEDEPYVSNLIQQLEHPPYSYKICQHSGNKVLQDFTIEQIFGSIKRARNTIIVLSPAYVKNYWCSIEFNAAFTEMRIYENYKIIVIGYSSDGKLDETELQPWLRSYLKYCIRLESNDKDCLKRLKKEIKFCKPRLSSLRPSSPEI